MTYDLGVKPCPVQYIKCNMGQTRRLQNMSRTFLLKMLSVTVVFFLRERIVSENQNTLKRVIEPKLKPDCSLRPAQDCSAVDFTNLWDLCLFISESNVVLISKQGDVSPKAAPVRSALMSFLQHVTGPTCITHQGGILASFLTVGAAEVYINTHPMEDTLIHTHTSFICTSHDGLIAEFLACDLQLSEVFSVH